MSVSLRSVANFTVRTRVSRVWTVVCIYACAQACVCNFFFFYRGLLLGVCEEKVPSWSVDGDDDDVDRERMVVAVINIMVIFWLLFIY